MKILKTMVLLLLVFINAHGMDKSWKMVKSENGIEVYTRPFPGSPIKEFYAETVIEGTLSAALAMLDDAGSYTRWMYRCREAALLLVKNEFERITYSVTSAPWPVNDRDIAVKSLVTQDKKTGAITITLSGLPGFIPARQGRVRMTSVNGYWKLEPLGSGKIRVTYRLHTEPGGSIPDSLVNSSLVDIPYNTLYNMRRLVLQAPYRDAKYRQLIEK